MIQTETNQKDDENLTTKEDGIEELRLRIA